MSLELSVGLVGLGVAIWSAVLSVRIGREQNRMQSHLLRFETARERDRVGEVQRASLAAELSRRPRSAVLVVRNHGRAPAREIGITVDGTPIAQHQLFKMGNPSLRLLAPDAQAEFIMLTHDGMPSVYHLELAWKDDSPEPGRWASELTLVH